VLQDKPPVIYGDGTQTRAFSHVADCVDPLVKMGCLPGLSGEVFNIGPDEAEAVVTVRDLAALILELMGASLEPLHVPARPREVRSATCSAGKARARLGYGTTVPLRTGLAETIAWMRRRGPRPFRYYLPVEIPSRLVPKTWTDHLL
jgi:UDP-glucose 4-epimerase